MPSWRVAVYLDGAPLATLDAPERPQIGNYRLVLPSSRLTGHRACLRLEAAPGETILLWYVRLEGLASAAGADPAAAEP